MQYLLCSAILLRTVNLRERKPRSVQNSSSITASTWKQPNVGHRRKETETVAPTRWSNSQLQQELGWGQQQGWESHFGEEARQRGASAVTTPSPSRPTSGLISGFPWITAWEGYKGISWRLQIFWSWLEWCPTGSYVSEAQHRKTRTSACYSE